MKNLTSKLPQKKFSTLEILPLIIPALVSIFGYGCSARNSFDYSKLPRGVDTKTAKIVQYLIENGRMEFQGNGRSDGYQYTAQFFLAHGGTAEFRYTDRTSGDNWKSNFKIGPEDFLETYVCSPTDTGDYCDGFIDMDLDGRSDKITRGMGDPHGSAYSDAKNEILKQIGELK